MHTQYAPDGNELEWQFKLQSRVQKPGEQLVEFAGALCVLVDKAYPKWSAEQVKEVLRNHFIQGVRSSSIQLKLMKEMPTILDAALQLASQQESVEAAQKRLHKEKSHAESLAVDQTDDVSRGACPSSVAAIRSCGTQSQTEVVVEQLTKQLRQLSEKVAQLRSRTTRTTQQTDQQQQWRFGLGPCWGCGATVQKGGGELQPPSPTCD